MRSGIPSFSTTRYSRPSVSPSWFIHFSASRVFCSIISLSWWLRTTCSMAVNSWNGLASKTMRRLPSVISPRLSVRAFLPAIFMTTSRIFFDFSASSLMLSSRRRYSPSVLLVSDISVSRVSAISSAEVYSFISTTILCTVP